MFNPTFKSELGPKYKRKLKGQFWTGLDIRLLLVVCALAQLYRDVLQLPLVVTCVNRTVRENKQAGGKVYSAHLFKCAVDIRVNNLSQAQIDIITDWLSDNLDSEVFYWVIHGTGNNKHLHINVRYGFRKSA